MPNHKEITVSKRLFSLNPFWSSPEILRRSDESLFLIATKNACSYITIFELSAVIGEERVKELFSVHEKGYSEPCRSILKNEVELLGGEIAAFDLDLGKERGVLDISLDFNSTF